MSKRTKAISALPLAAPLSLGMMNDFPATNAWINDFATSAEQMAPETYPGIDFERIARELANNPGRQQELQYLIDQMGQ